MLPWLKPVLHDTWSCTKSRILAGIMVCKYRVIWALHYTNLYKRGLASPRLPRASHNLKPPLPTYTDTCIKTWVLWCMEACISINVLAPRSGNKCCSILSVMGYLDAWQLQLKHVNVHDSCSCHASRYPITDRMLQHLLPLCGTTVTCQCVLLHLSHILAVCGQSAWRIECDSDFWEEYFNIYHFHPYLWQQIVKRIQINHATNGAYKQKRISWHCSRLCGKENP
jgi:hypothetical protein